MSAVTGPISTLPGSRHRLPENTTCDDHPDRPAVTRIQGETDSFGSEMFDLCQECLDSHNEFAAEEKCGICEYCKAEHTDLRDTRDHEEGSCGPIYRICGSCDRKRLAAIEEELSQYDEECDF